MKRTLLAVAGASVLGLAAAGAYAQTTPAAPPPAAAAARPAGPAIPGVCTFSQDRVIANSTVGKAVDARLKQITAAVEAELTPERNWIQTEERALVAAQSATTPTMTREQFEQRALTLRQRTANYERTAQIRVRELQATQNKALMRIATEMRPIISAVYAERGCGLMIDQGVLYGASPSMDVTDLVIQRLNAKIQNFAFDRERLDTAAAAGARPPAPATPAPAPKKK